jgi:hypothetical protein
MWLIFHDEKRVDIETSAHGIQSKNEWSRLKRERERMKEEIDACMHAGMASSKR